MTYGEVLNEVLKDEKRIALAINEDGVNDSGFVGYVSTKYWPELANMGNTKMGTVLSRKVAGKEFYALCCYSLQNGWNYDEVTKCFDAIPGDEPIASTVGTDIMGAISGADLQMLVEAMEASKKQIEIFNFMG